MTIEFPTIIQISFHKFNIKMFLQVLKFLSFNRIIYQSHAKVLCTFKLNSQCTFNGSLRQKLRRHLKMMAVIQRTDFILGQFAFEPKNILVHINQPRTDLENCFISDTKVNVFGL